MGGSGKDNLPLSLLCYNESMDTITKEMLRLRELGQIDGMIGAKEVGRIIDFWNKQVEERLLKDFTREINARNKYYWKLWKMAIEEMRSGRRLPPRKVPNKKTVSVKGVIKSGTNRAKVFV